ncbi:very low-density lipoprotein receptor-like [Planococcus citri]|uniref:very low-density lipoprotein receptor-like n=1 Tax=Planococcus citri TaxID=170843 RepID=UPI0031F77B20
MKVQFTGVLIVWCLHVLKCHSTPLTADFVKCRSPKYYQCYDSKCILSASVCNGFKDCDNGADEIGCNKTASTDFRCGDKMYIPESWTCDGHTDCLDNSDETIGCEQKKCKYDEFQCKNNICRPLAFKCDGMFDCSDHSDEENCDYPTVDMSNCTLSNGKFACKDKFKCIDINKTCDLHTDCFDGSDEKEACSTGRITIADSKSNLTSSKNSKENHFVLSLSFD